MCATRTARSESRPDATPSCGVSTTASRPTTTASSIGAAVRERLDGAPRSRDDRAARAVEGPPCSGQSRLVRSGFGPSLCSEESSVTDTATDIESIPVAGLIGAEVQGVDLSADLDASTIEGIWDELTTHKVLFF